MSDCEAFLDLISAHLDGELTAEEETALARHLEQCPRCTALLHELEAVQADLHALPDVEPPADLKGRILSAVKDAEPISAAPPATGGRRPAPWRRLTAVAAMAAVVVVCAVAVSHLGAWNQTAPLSERMEQRSSGSASNSAQNSVPEAAVDKAAAPTVYGVAPESTVLPDESAVTAMLLCYGVETLPEVPDYLLEETADQALDYPSWLCPAEQLSDLQEVLRRSDVTTALQTGQNYTGTAGEWVRVTVAP